MKALPTMDRAADAVIVRASKLVARKSKGMIGHEQPIWPGLKPATIARKEHGNTPLYETGELKDSIEWSAPHHEAGDTVGYVGTNDENAKYHEYGTSRIPPRPFISTAAMAQERIIHEMIGAAMFAAMQSQLSRAFHVWEHVFHEVDALVTRPLAVC
jgi:phage gpG-like protein